MTTDMTTETNPDQAAPARQGPLRRTMLLLRVLVTAEAVLVLDQAVLAGGFLSGHYEALDLHALGATVTGIVALLQAVAALLVWRAGRGPWWPLLVSMQLFVAEGAQIGMGYQRILAVHVPLGATIIATTAVLLVWVWRPVLAGRKAKA